VYFAAVLSDAAITVRIAVSRSLMLLCQGSKGTSCVPTFEPPVEPPARLPSYYRPPTYYKPPTYFNIPSYSTPSYRLPSFFPPSGDDDDDDCVSSKGGSKGSKGCGSKVCVHCRSPLYTRYVDCHCNVVRLTLDIRHQGSKSGDDDDDCIDSKGSKSSKGSKGSKVCTVLFFVEHITFLFLRCMYPLIHFIGKLCT